MRRNRNLTLTLPLLSALFLFTFLPIDDGLAATFFVDQAHPNARDANPGTDPNFPWLTLGRAMSVPAGSTVFVKNGTYSPTPPRNSFRTINSGTATSPIAFRAFTPPSGPRHTPVLTRNITSQENNPVIVVPGPAMQGVIWDGFALAPRTNVLIHSASDVTIENLLIDKGPGPCVAGNYDGIFVQASTRVSIRNNVIRNISYTGSVGGCTDNNAAGITLYDTNNILVHNNEISAVGTGLYDKRNGVSNIHERNYIHDIRGHGIQFNNYADRACGACPVQDNVVRQNVIVNAGTGVALRMSTRSTPVSDNHVYNNTIYNVWRGIYSGAQLPRTQVYNNIVHIKGSFSDAADYVFGGTGGFYPDFSSDFSNFTATTGSQARFIPVEFGPVETLAQWQARGRDLNSTTLNPLFVGPLTGTPPPVTNYRLQSSSPLVGAGRTGGVSSGSSVTMGAYISDADVIGPR